MLNARDSTPVENALLQCGGQRYYSTVSGEFEIKLGESKLLEIRHPGYKNYRKLINTEGRLVIYLVPKSAQLAEVEVKAKSTFSYGGVKDFCWLDNRLLVSYYRGNTHLFDIRGNAGEMERLAVVSDKMKIDKLLTDCYGRVFGLYQDSVIRISIRNDSLIVGNSYPWKEFSTFYERCALADSSYQVNKYLLGHNKGIVYAIDGVQLEEELTLYSQLDTAQFLTTNRIFDRWRAVSGHASLAMADIGLKELSSSRTAFDLRSFYLTLKKPEIYLPIFKKQQEWWLFDHVVGELVIFEPGDTLALETSKIGYQQNINWGKEIIQSTTGELYLKYQSKGGKAYLQLFNSQSKTPQGIRMALKESFPKKILVSENKAVYTFKNAGGFYELAIEPLNLGLASQ